MGDVPVHTPKRKEPGSDVWLTPEVAGWADGGCNLSTARDGGAWAAWGRSPLREWRPCTGLRSRPPGSRPLPCLCEPPALPRALPPSWHRTCCVCLGMAGMHTLLSETGRWAVQRASLESGACPESGLGKGGRLARMTSPPVTALTVKFTFRGQRWASELMGGSPGSLSLRVRDTGHWSLP